MKPTNFSKYISDFITRYLINERGASSNTIAAYRDSFILFINFIETIKDTPVEKITLEKITKDVIIEFLNWLEVVRKSSKTSRNARLAAIHSFFKYLQRESLENLFNTQQILAIRFKRVPAQTMNYLTVDGIKLLLEQPDTRYKKGRRDLALLGLMYDTGARVQEVIDLTPGMIRLNNPPTIKIIGKGNKARLVPMIDAQIEHLKSYLKENHLNEASANMYPLFYNSRREKLTRAGISYIVSKYYSAARKINAGLIPNKISCHSLRHSKAMHLLQSGVNLVYIRDILGHVSIQTTEIYARADSKQKRIALEKAYVNLNPGVEPTWEKNDGLITWLKSF
jgi:integrase/recombinase XerD